MKKSDFNYQLPEHLIAQEPLAERNASRLLILDAGLSQIKDASFNDFDDLVNDRDLLVFNNTKVIPARLYGKKQTGGKVEILIERVKDDAHASAHMKASKAPKPGTLIELDQGIQCQVMGRDEDLFELQFSGGISVHEILELIGHIPLPPYITRADNQQDYNRYQTVFAKEKGAIAAPTAGLHFDQAMMQRLQQKGVASTFVTLHVGSGTFQPVRVENIADHVMHYEYYEVSETAAEAVRACRDRGGRVIAIGTTSVRALESASQGGQLCAGFGETNLFITPGYEFKSVDGLLTNFHLPESTLLMLVSAFAGYENIMQAYHHAVQQSYRFFSYGDAMFIKP